MISKLLIPFLIVISMTPIVGCYKASDYSGDGQLVDNGWSAAIARYVLALDAVDLSRGTTKTYRIENLPEEEFVAGIEVTLSPEDRDAIENRRIRPVISLKLLGPDREVIFKKKGRLDEWSWSFSGGEARTFIYGRDEQRTYFQPQSGVEYQLTISALYSDPSQLNYTAVLMTKSGGWK